MKPFLAMIFTLALSPLALASPGSDEEIINKLTKGGAAEVELGNLVQQKASNPAVRDFGKRMAEDHAAMLQQTQKWAAKNGTKVSTTPGEEERSILNQVSKLSGAEFDRAYISGMLDDHRKDVEEVARYIVGHPDSPAKSLLTQALPILENHLRVAENVAGQIGVKPDKGLAKPEHPSS